MVPRLMNRMARWLVRHPLGVLAGMLAVTVVLGWFALGLRIESSLESVLPAGDPQVFYYEQVRQKFGSDDVGVIGVRSDDLFSAGTLEKIARVTNAVAKLDGVESVLSITNAKDVAADVFTPPPLLPKLPPSPDEVAALRAKLAAVPLYRENLVAPDERGAAINVFFKPLSDVQYADLRLDDRIAEILRAEEGPEKFYFTGAAHLKEAAVRLMRRDLFRFTPIALVGVIITFWLSFRTKRGVLLPLVTVVMALVWTLGVLVAMGKAITLGTFVLPPLLLVVGSSYAIHVMARYYESAEHGRDEAEVVGAAFDRVWVPLCISAVTTVIGFGALMVNRIPAIWELGFFAVIGTIFLTIVCLVFLPAMLALLPIERVAVRAQDGSPALTPVLSRVARVAAGSRSWIWLLAGGLAVLAVTGIMRIQVDSDFLSYFSPRAEVRRDNEVINREIVGSNPFYVIIDGRVPEALKKWTTLWLIKDLQQFLENQPGITSSVSIVDYLELLESGLNKGTGGDLVVDAQGKIVPAEKPKTFWEDPAMLAPVLEMVNTSPDTFKSVVTPDFSTASILVRTNLSGSAVIEETLSRIRAYIANHFPADIPVHLTGNLVLLTGTTSEIVAGQVKSLALALGVIFIVMSLMFLSMRIGFLAILPNVLPILIFFGVMGWFGIYLNLGTSLIAAIALGIAVDSTIHYMARLNLELRGEEDQEAAIARTLTTVGAPIIYTTVALFLGFLTFAFSSFVPIQNFGVLSSVTMATALGANLLLLPAFLATAKIITLWDLVGLKLGEDPARTIPLFAGLRPSQARVVVLMGDMLRFRPGETIVQQGDPGDAMYVVLNGDAEVLLNSNGSRRPVANLHRGDVFGEMALVRHNERTADVVATSDVEVLAVDERFLQRIQRRYPRIASRVFLNLTSILSDRLERMNSAYMAARATTTTSPET